VKRKGWLVKMFNDQSGICAYCKVEMTLSLGYNHTATKDHIVPRAHKGSNHKSNLIAACYKCNYAKADKPLSVFLEELRNE